MDMSHSPNGGKRKWAALETSSNCAPPPKGFSIDGPGLKFKPIPSLGLSLTLIVSQTPSISSSMYMERGSIKMSQNRLKPDPFVLLLFLKDNN